MTGPSGKSQIYLPLEIKDRLQKNSIYRGAAEVNRNSWGGDSESLGANRSAYHPRDQSLFVCYMLFYLSFFNRLIATF